MRATRKLQHIAPSRYLSPSLIIEVASFSLYFFTWKLCMSVTLGRTPHLADPGVIGNVYAILLAFTGLGYVLFWVAGAYLPGSMEKRTAAAAAMSLCVTGAIGMVATLRLPGFLIASCATILALGYLGAAVHHGFSLVSYESEVSGRALGIGMGVASLLEYLVETLGMTPTVFMVCVVLSALAILWLDGRPARRWLYDCRPSPQQVSGVSKRSIVLLAVAAAAMTLDYGLLDGVLVWNYANGNILSTGLSKIAYSLSLPFVGVLFDLKKGRLRSLITICAMFLVAAAVPAAETPEGMPAAAFIAGIYGSFYLMYLSASFMRVAPKTSCPEIVASMGRTISCLVGALGALFARLLFESLGVVVTVTLSCLLSVVCLLVLVRDIAWGITENLDEEGGGCGGLIQESALPSREEALVLYAEKIGLTAREGEVYTALLTTDLGVQEIADGLFISRRVAQRHISAIYEKAGVSTRVGLYREFDAWFDEFKTRERG
ncbi:helix-turn-helix transcriptional regulator [Parolsenella catena]|uniref:helix-turn-helix transcriptional regulator n=1 Tax=Parolsenella catena TaxID=2003188 RepID=UPI002FE0B246